MVSRLNLVGGYDVINVNPFQQNLWTWATAESKTSFVYLEILAWLNCAIGILSRLTSYITMAITSVFSIDMVSDNQVWDSITLYSCLFRPDHPPGGGANGVFVFMGVGTQNHETPWSFSEYIHLSLCPHCVPFSFFFLFLVHIQTVVLFYFILFFSRPVQTLRLHTCLPSDTHPVHISIFLHFLSAFKAQDN